MPDQEEIQHQLHLLTLHRRTLAGYLSQQAALGGAAYTTPPITNGLHETWENIRRIKDILREWGVVVEDLPDDSPSPSLLSPPPAAFLPLTPRPQSPGNPFTPGPFAPADRFFGRQKECDAIVARLGTMLSVSLVGAARMGKTSLLRYLEARLPSLLNDQYCLAIYVSMDSVENQAHFCKTVLETLLAKTPVLQQSQSELDQTVQALDRRLRGNVPVTLAETVKTVEWFSQAGLRIVLLLDEFKNLLDQPIEFNDVFRGVLRSLYTNRTIALVLSTRQPLTEIAGLSAYFANGLSQLPPLGPLADSDAAQLLQQTHDRWFNDAEVRIGLEAGSGHPLRLQWAGWWLYTWKGQETSPIHAQPGILHDHAAQILAQEVQREYDQMMNASGIQNRKRSVKSWFVLLKQRLRL
jgi:hypothetical protein